MLRSMTGYGTAEGVVAGRKLIVEIKTVNHRYFNFTAKLPQNLSILEMNVQTLAKAHLSRGQVSVFASWDRRGSGGAMPSINVETAKALFEDLKKVRKELSIGGDIEISHLLSIPALYTQAEPSADPEELWEGAKPVFEKALLDMDALRRREGDDLLRDLKGKLAVMTELMGKIEGRRSSIVAEQKLRLEKRIGELVPEVIFDVTVAERLAVEIALFADRVDVNEELVRLRSHVEKFLEMLSMEGAVGRKIDFLIQEMNREVNTIGSKTPDADSSAIVVEMKSELERIREQVQNIE